MNTTPATIRIAPKMMRELTVSRSRRNSKLNKTVNSGVVLSKGMITDIWPRPNAIKLQNLGYHRDHGGGEKEPKTLALHAELPRPAGGENEHQ